MDWCRYIDITQGELSTLQSATDRGNETTNSIKVQGINYGGSVQQNNIIIGDNVEGLNFQTTNTISIGKNLNQVVQITSLLETQLTLHLIAVSIGNTVIGNSTYSNGYIHQIILLSDIVPLIMLKTAMGIPLWELMLQVQAETE